MGQTRDALKPRPPASQKVNPKIEAKWRSPQRSGCCRCYPEILSQNQASFFAPARLIRFCESSVRDLPQQASRAARRFGTRVIHARPAFAQGAVGAVVDLEPDSIPDRESVARALAPTARSSQGQRPRPPFEYSLVRAASAGPFRRGGQAHRRFRPAPAPQSFAEFPAPAHCRYSPDFFSPGIGCRPRSALCPSGVIRPKLTSSGLGALVGQ